MSKAKKAAAKKKVSPRKVEEAHYMFGAELVTTYVAVCLTCNENLGKATRKKPEAQEQADNHKKIYKQHKVDVISSD